MGSSRVVEEMEEELEENNDSMVISQKSGTERGKGTGGEQWECEEGQHGRTQVEEEKDGSYGELDNEVGDRE